MKRKGAFLFGLALSAGFLAYAAAKLDFGKAFEAIGQMRPFWLLPFAGLFFAVLYLRAVRLWYITEPLKPVSTRNLWSSICIGFMGNMIFPMRMGELIRVYVVSRREAVPASGILATIVVERTFDVVFTVMVLVVAVFVLDPSGISPGVWEKAEWAAGALAVAAAAMGIGLYRLSLGGGVSEARFLRLVRRLPPEVAKRVERLFISFRGGLMVLRSGRHLMGVVLVSGAIYIGLAATNLFILPMFGLPFSVEMAVVLTAFSLVGVAVPSAPGSVGTYHAGIVFAFTLYGVDASRALGISIFMHAFMFTALVLAGMYYTWRDHFKLSELRHSADM